ncbi:anaerobic sulfite reductase subunit AsrB [Muricomes sp. OA1]|uniref:Anaerobic sulfite reductase subunit AsrB n=2 Tax=Lachnospiraceae TaxID=186803 RepID=A0A3E2WXY2_9FIRM|nr:MULTISPECIES: anaerobic sulfite reductase subunit AsrB [Clostridia]MEE0200818.1 anaerobic sulfite reductase subunit AsrB [Muricomes sp.]MCH1974588.1 anaerobic sulfite reductase subunit AsrB [Muricomes sp. OA1]MRM89047.1 anaerobic sulfite reductase subunit AsrB [Faecalicatena contorta]RGC33023.1 anaerobic sulfite reductase subunit AsrB [Hungatella hathewayi]GKH33369.1 anaerobic sulfite reductase subunit B [Faecalicatena contorta]
MMNPVMPKPCTIMDVHKESEHEWTFRVASDVCPAHGQFMQLSIPKIGEAPISVSAQGEGWLEFTIRSVGKVTDCIFSKEPGDVLFLRGPYGKGWPVDEFAGKHIVVITGGTGLAPVRSMLRSFAEKPEYVKSVHLISGFKNEEGIIFSGDLAKWEEQFVTTYALDTDRKEGWRTGFVTEFVKEIPFDEFQGNYAVVVVGPPPMMKFTGLELMKYDVDPEKVWMSFERKMSCAIGKCGHCRIDEVYVCTDGPVFPYTAARDLVD